MPDLTGLDVEWLDSGDGPVIWFERGPVGVIVNTSTETHSTRVSLDTEIVYSTSQVEWSENRDITIDGVGAVVYLSL